MQPYYCETHYWHSIDGNRVQCDLCPRECKLKPGQRGLCFVRENRDGQVMLNSYGRSSGFCIDPIEKKPLNHFFPGSPVLSFGTAGCNLACKFCQNWDISKSREIEKLSSDASPQAIAASAKKYHCRSVAFTYNDPIIFHEYAIDVAKACHEQGIASVAVTSGYVSEQPRREFFRFMDAANIDLKAFTDEFYYRLTGGHLQPVLDTLVYLKNETNTWFEITTLLIPGCNDSDEEVKAMCEWIRRNLGSQVPLHFTAFHPDWKMRDKPATPASTLIRARQIGLDAGLKYVYTGNLHDHQSQSTYCAACGELLIGRDWYELDQWHLDSNGGCEFCGNPLDGHFEALPGSWGSRRQPIAIT